LGCGTCRQEKEQKELLEGLAKGTIHPERHDKHKCSRCKKFLVKYWNFRLLKSGKRVDICLRCERKKKTADEFLQRERLARKVEKLIKQLDARQ
jgi:hypothetical protein